MANSFHSILDKYRKISFSEKDKGEATPLTSQLKVASHLLLPNRTAKRTVL